LFNNLYEFIAICMTIFVTSVGERNQLYSKTMPKALKILSIRKLKIELQ